MVRVSLPRRLPPGSESSRSPQDRMLELRACSYLRKETSDEAGDGIVQEGQCLETVWITSGEDPDTRLRRQQGSVVSTRRHTTLWRHGRGLDECKLGRASSPRPECADMSRPRKGRRHPAESLNVARASRHFAPNISQSSKRGSRRMHRHAASGSAPYSPHDTALCCCH